MSGYIVLEDCDNEIDVVAKTATIEEAIENCLEDAEDNGYVPSVASRKELKDRLMSDLEYTDGVVVVRIVKDC